VEERRFVSRDVLEVMAYKYRRMKSRSSDVECMFVLHSSHPPKQAQRILINGVSTIAPMPNIQLLDTNTYHNAYREVLFNPHLRCLSRFRSKYDCIQFYWNQVGNNNPDLSNGKLYSAVKHDWCYWCWWWASESGSSTNECHD
jgi:hypothetical protein